MLTRLRCATTRQARLSSRSAAKGFDIGSIPSSTSTPSHIAKPSVRRPSSASGVRICRLVALAAMKYPCAMKREDIIRDIHGLDAELAKLEEQYGLLSADFYHCFRAGELEQTRDFIRWAGYYEAKLEREARYRKLVYEHLRELRRQSGLGALELTPAGA